MKVFLLVVVILTIVTISSAQKHKVTQIGGNSLEKTFNNTEYTLLYIYSSSCTYCRQFTPLYEKLSNQQFFTLKNIQFLKIDEQLFKDELEKYGIHSFPTVLLYWRDYSQYPIRFKQQRTQAKMKQFVEKNTKVNENTIPDILEMSPYQRIDQKIVIYYGTKQSPLYQAMGLIWSRDTFFNWALVPIKQGQPQRVEVGNKKLTGENLTIDVIESTVQKVFARVHRLGEEPWVRIFQNKQLGIVFVNTENNRILGKLFQQMAKQHWKLVFLELTPDHPQFKAALRTFTVTQDEKIIAVDRRSQAVFIANSSYSIQYLNDFISKVKTYQWPVHRKSERTTQQQKLTRENYNLKMSTKQDIVLFLYKRQQKISKSLIELFNHLRQKLADNKNLMFLRCDVSSNQIEEFLGFSVEKTPKLVFLRDRMKDKPIHFYDSKISEQSVTQFIMQNTTFDWKDEWGEL